MCRSKRACGKTNDEVPEILILHKSMFGVILKAMTLTTKVSLLTDS